MFKKYGILSCALLMGMGALKADSSMDSNAQPNIYNGGWVAGVAATTLQSNFTNAGNAGAAFQLGYYAPCWLIDLGVSNVATPKYKFSYTFLMGHLGLRNRVYNNLSVTYGAMGLGNIATQSRYNAWSAGAFLGLDYQFTEHFMISGKAYPYNFDHKRGRYPNNIFANATVSLFYVF